MVKMDLVYEGDLHTVVRHEPSEQTLHTDAPKDNGGLAETFSPTDLLGAALISCIATVIGIYGQKKGWDLRGMRLSVEKQMSSDGPRRIAAVSVEIWMPCKIEESEKQRVLRVAKTCPVHHSIHPEIEAPITIHWAE